MDYRLFWSQPPLDLFKGQPVIRVFVVKPRGKFALVLNVIDVPQVKKVSSHIVLLGSRQGVKTALNLFNAHSGEVLRLREAGARLIVKSRDR